MKWEEVEIFSDAEAKQNGYKGIWTIPAYRMKAKREHRVPITDPMYGLLRGIGSSEGFVFKSQRMEALSDMTLSALMKRVHSGDEHGLLTSVHCYQQCHMACGRHSEIG